MDTVISQKKQNLGNSGLVIFFSSLYDQICAGYFADASISFSVPLSKVQIFNLKKQLKENEKIFITPIVGENCDIPI